MRPHAALSALAAPLLASLAFGAPIARADSAALADIPLPPRAASRLVSNDMVQNGLLVSVATLEPAAGLNETIAFYRDAWPADENGPGHLEALADEWTIISRVSGDVSLVVQLKEDGPGSSGLISAMSLVPVGASGMKPPPLPAGGELLSSTITSDAGLEANTSVVSSTAGSGEVAGFYRDAMRRAGWKLVSERRTGGPVTLLFDGRDARLEIVVSDARGGSVAVVNEVRSDD